MSRRDDFSMLACMFGLGELTVLAFAFHQPGLWRDEPVHVGSILVFLLFAVFLPISAVYLLWMSKRSVLEFVLLIFSAMLAVPAFYLAFFITLGVFHGESLTALHLLGYVPIVVTLICCRVNDTLHRGVSAPSPTERLL